MKRFYIIKNNKGAALLFAIMVLLFMAMAAVAFTMLATTAFQTAARDVSRQQSFYYARSVGLAISDQIIENYNMSDIVKALDEDADNEIIGSYFIEKIGATNELMVNGEENIRFYYPDEGNKNFIYIDVVTTYNGATEVVTSVLTCINEEDLGENMFNLFSVYNIYSTLPDQQRFAFANTGTTGIAPSVYLYNGEGQSDATFDVENNISADLTSNGNVTVLGSGGVRTITGQLTSYGDIDIEQIVVNGNVIVSGDLYIDGLSSSKINGNIYARGNVTLKGTGSTQQLCTGTIYATGNVDVISARVGNIVGGENCDVNISNSTVGSVNTRGELVALSSTISGNIFTGEKFDITSCAISGNIESRGTAVNKIVNSTIGSAASSKTVYCYGDLKIERNTTTKSNTIYGNVMVDGTLANNSGYESTINGNLTVKKPYNSTIGSVSAVLIRNLVVNGNVDIREANATAAFSISTSTSTIYSYGQSGSCKTKITGWLFMDAGFHFGTEALPTYLNLFGAELNNVQAGNVNVTTGTLDNVKILGGTIKGKLLGNSLDLQCISTLATTTISGIKPNYEGAEGGNISISGRSTSQVTINGTVYAEGNIDLGDYVILPATDPATVRAEGDGIIRGADIYGEFIVDGSLSIKGAADLYGNENELYIYVNKDLSVDASTGYRDAGSTTETASRIYVYGNTTLYGKVGDLYLMGADPGDGTKLRIYPTGAILGVEKTLTDMLIIDGNRGGVIMDNPDGIVYFKSNSVISGEMLKVAGTLIIPQSLSINLPNVYANKIITPATPISYEDNDDLINKLRSLTEQPTAVINATINGNFVTYSSFTTSLRITSYVNNDININFTQGAITFDGANVGGTVFAENASSVTLSNATVGSIRTNALTLNSSSIIKKDAEVTGTATINSGCIVGNDSNATTQYTLEAQTVNANSGSVIKNNVRASGKVTLTSCTANYNIQAAQLVMSSATAKGNIKITNSSLTSTIAGTVNGSIESAGNITVTSGTVGSAGSRFVEAKTLNMLGGTLGSNTNIYLTSTSTATNNYIRASSLNNVRVEKGNLTTIDGASVNGTLYVGGSVTFVNHAPSAGDGIYAGNSSQSLGSGSFGNVGGPVHLPNYTGSATFETISGELWAPSASSISIQGAVSGNIRSKNVTIHSASSSNLSYSSIDVSGYLKIYNYASGQLTFNGVVSCNTLVVNCDLSAYTSVGTSYSTPSGTTYLSNSSTSRDRVLFKNNVRVDYLSSTYRGNAYIRGAKFYPATLYADGGVYSKYCDYYSYGYTDIYTHTLFGTSSDGYYKSNYGSFYAGLNSTYSNNVYFDNCSVYSHIDIRRSAGTTFKSSIIGINRNNGDWDGMSSSNRKKFSKYYRFVGNTTLNGTRIYGVTDNDSGDHVEEGRIIVHVVSGNLVLSNSSWIGWYSSSVGSGTDEPSRGDLCSFDGIYLSSGNLTNGSGCTITLNIFVKGNLVNQGVINIKGKDGVNFRGGYIWWYGSKSNSGWINYDHLSWPYNNNKGRYKQNSTISVYTPNTDWQMVQTDYTTTAGNTTLNGIVNYPSQVVKSYNTSYFSVPNYNVDSIANIDISMPANLNVNFVSEPEIMKTASSGGKAPETPLISGQIGGLMGNVTRVNPASMHNYVRSTNEWNPLAIPVKWYEPTSTVEGTTVKLNNRTDNILSVKVENIGLVGGSVSGKLGLYAVDAARYKYASNKINDIMSTKGSNDMILYTKNFQIIEGWPWEWQYTKRQVGIFFFESGIVPTNVFNATYRDDSDKEDGRYLWGNPGLLGAGGDCVWTFFTCADPRNPYTSAAKDLHIILPENIGMQWSKDKDNALNIIGNGRVFLYLRSGANIKAVGNGFYNYLSGVFGGSSNNTFGMLRYADRETGVVNDNLSTGVLQPRIFLVGVGGSIRFEVKDFQTFSYVYMPRGYSYTNKNPNEFVVTASSDFFSGGNGTGNWDIIGMYVTDKFSYNNSANAKVNYVETVPDLTNTVINGKQYRLSEFWDYPEDMPRAGLIWKYKGIVVR